MQMHLNSLKSIDFCSLSSQWH
ncbi:unnamed protein product [Linum tenue]|uniref:Uncharacterized protein n=1 Tax=Linum tenue TaxID=586396 RepID=A0AAV0NBI5_9ROSI|nr:unnamed protein product [Linum tenue]